MIWIGLDFIGPIVGMFSRGSNAVSITVNVITLLFALFGFYAAYAGKRVLLKSYAIMLVLIVLARSSLNLWMAYSPDVKNSTREQFLNANPGLEADFERAWEMGQMMIIGAVAWSLIIEGIILLHIRAYNNYLADLEDSNKKTIA
jgi:predicted GH43/DUF377 family glycosyl hydrolase